MMVCATSHRLARARSPGVQDRRPVTFTFDPVETRGTVPQVVERIVEPIRLGRLRYGDRLPSERALAQQLRVSRETVRKAVRRLVEARRVFEPRVAQLAGLLATEDDFAALQEIIDTQRELADDPQRVRDLDAPFHLALARATHNATVVALMQTLFQRLDVAKRFAIEPGEAQRAIEIHESTLAALMGRDPQAIEITMDQHLSILEDAWERESGRALPRRVPAFLLPSD